MARTDRAQQILDMIRKRRILSPDQEGWISPPIITEPQPPEPLPENRWSEFSRDFIVERDGEPIRETGYTTKEFYEKILEVSDPDYENKENKKTSQKLKDLLKGIESEEHKLERIVEHLNTLEPFEAVIEKDQ